MLIIGELLTVFRPSLETTGEIDIIKSRQNESIFQFLKMTKSGSNNKA